MKLVDYFKKKPIKAIAITVAIISAIVIISVNQNNVTNTSNVIEKQMSEDNYDQTVELIDKAESQQSEKISLIDLCNRCASNSDFEEQYQNKYFEFKVTAYFDKYEIKNKQEKFSCSVKFNEKHNYELICKFTSEETMKQVPDGATASIKGKFTKLVYNTLYFEDCEVLSFEKAEQNTSAVPETTAPETTSPPVIESPVQTTASRETPIDYVYIAASGNGAKYHKNRNCSGMNGNVIEISKEDAKSAGYSACGRCY